MVVVGIDSHKQTLVGCAVDEAGRQLEYRSFENVAQGYREALRWIRELGVERVAIEGSGSYGRPLALALTRAGVGAVEVPPQMTDRARRSQRSRYKSDPGDALLIARVALREPDLGSPRPSGGVEDLRSLVFYRREQTTALNQEANRLHADLEQLCPGYHQHIRTRLTLPSSLNQATKLISDDQRVRADIARRRISAIQQLITTIRQLDTQIRPLTQQTGADTLCAIDGIATLGAAEIIAQVGNPTRYPTKAKFAMANGTAPLQASSGQTIRHRLNRGGNRRLNRTIHIAAITQTRRPGTEGRQYYERLPDRGKTKKEAIRILKRRISDRIWTHLQQLTPTPNLT